MCGFLKISIYKDLSPARREFYFFLSNMMCFNFNFCLMFLARISRTMLNRSGKSIYPYLVPDRKEKADDKDIYFS